MIPNCTYQPKEKHQNLVGRFHCPNVPVMIVLKDEPSREVRHPPTKKGEKGDIICVVYEHEWEDLCSYHQYLTGKNRGGKES